MHVEEGPPHDVQDIGDGTTQAQIQGNCAPPTPQSHSGGWLPNRNEPRRHSRGNCIAEPPLRHEYIELSPSSREAALLGLGLCCLRQGSRAPNRTQPLPQKSADDTHYAYEAWRKPPPWMDPETRVHSVASRTSTSVAPTGHGMCCPRQGPRTPNGTQPMSPRAAPTWKPSWLGPETSMHSVASRPAVPIAEAKSQSEGLLDTVVLHINIQGIRSHLAELSAVIRLIASPPEIICVNETFLDEGVEDIVLAGYSVVGRRDRSFGGVDKRRCGGIIVFARADIADHVTPMLTSATHERIWLQLHTNSRTQEKCSPLTPSTPSLRNYGGTHLGPYW